MSDAGDEMRTLVFDECRDKMRKAVAHLQEEFGGIRTGRATPGLVEKLKVDAYGAEVPLQQIAGISIPEPRVLVKVVRNRAEEGRVAVRNIRRQTRHDLEALEKDGDLSKNDLDRAEKE